MQQVAEQCIGSQPVTTQKTFFRNAPSFNCKFARLFAPKKFAKKKKYIYQYMERRCSRKCSMKGIRALF